MTSALILAGGSGNRLGELGIPKQFARVADVPLIMYSIWAFECSEGIDSIAIVIPERWQERLCGWLDERGIEKFRAFAPPGRTRQHSILNGLLALQPLNPQSVIIHDAARPLVTEQDIGDCLRAFDGHDGATPAVPLSETVYQSADGVLVSSLLNRDELFAGQTPECYKFAPYLEACKALSDDELGRIRGSSEIAFRAGMKIRLYKGNPQNFKVTTAVNFSFFRHLIEERSL